MFVKPFTLFGVIFSTTAIPIPIQANIEISKYPEIQTWIITFNTLENLNSQSLLFVAPLHRELHPLVLVYSEFHHEKNITSYFNREFSDDEIYYSSKINVKFTPWEFVVLVFGSSYNVNSKLTNDILIQKLGRPHIDRFIQIYTNITEIEIVVNSEYGRRFSYCEYFVFNQEGIIRSKIINTGTHLLNGREIVAAVTSFPEKMRFNSKDRNGGLIGGQGVYFEILVLVSNYFNFSYTILPGGGSGATGRRLDDGTWNGAVGDITYSRVEFGIMIGASYIRHRVLDFTTNLDLYTRIFYIRLPPKSFTWKSIVLPFEFMVWLAVLATTLSCIVVLLANLYLWNHKLYPPYIKNTDSSYDVFGGIFKVMVDQDSSLRKSQDSRTRFVFFLVTIFGLLIGTAYRSKLMSSLTRPKQVTDMPRTHKELAYSDYTLYFRYYGGVVYQYTANSKDPVHQTMLKKMLLVNTSAECVTLALLNENSACLDYEPAGDYAISSNTSLSPTSTVVLFKKSNDKDLSVGSTWAFRKCSPLTSRFNRVFLRMLASGLKEQWTKLDEEKNKFRSSKWIKEGKNNKLKKLVTAYSMQEIIKELPLSVFYGLGFVYVGTIASALVIFVIELYFKNDIFKNLTTNYIL